MKTISSRRFIALFLTLCTLFAVHTIHVHAEEAYQTLDTSEIERLIVQSEAVVANRASYVPSTYDNYMNVIEEAKKYYHGEHLSNFNQANVDAMADTIRAAYKNLLNVSVGDPLRAVIQLYYSVDCASHATDPYSIETWALYSLMIQSAQSFLDSGDYDTARVNQMVMPIMMYRNMMLVRERTVANQRIESLISAGFQTSYVYEESTARIAVNTKSEYGIVAAMVFDEDGNIVAQCTYTTAPYNRRKPNQQIVYIDFPIDEEPGVHTYTVYAVDSEGLCSKNAAICSIEVRER